VKQDVLCSRKHGEPHPFNTSVDAHFVNHVQGKVNPDTTKYL